MIFKKQINSYMVKDVPQNGVITMDIENEKGEVVEVTTGVSNLPLAFENDIRLANKNGYYEYVEDEAPDCGEGDILEYEYILDGNVLRKTYSIRSAEECIENVGAYEY